MHPMETAEIARQHRQDLLATAERERLVNLARRARRARHRTSALARVRDLLNPSATNGHRADVANGPVGTAAASPTS